MLASGKCHDVLENAKSWKKPRLLLGALFSVCFALVRRQWNCDLLHWTNPSRLYGQMGIGRQPRRLFSLVQFSGSFVGVLVSSALVSAKGFKPANHTGLAMLGLGFALLNAPTFALALAASGIYGLGYGFATPGTNLWVGEMYGERRASALNIMNLAWGAGAISSSRSLC